MRAVLKCAFTAAKNTAQIMTMGQYAFSVLSMSADIPSWACTVKLHWRHWSIVSHASAHKWIQWQENEQRDSSESASKWNKLWTSVQSKAVDKSVEIDWVNKEHWSTDITDGHAFWLQLSSKSRSGLVTIDDSSLDKLICCIFTYNKTERHINSSGFGNVNFKVVFVHDSNRPS